MNKIGVQDMVLKVKESKYCNIVTLKQLSIYEIMFLYQIDQDLPPYEHHMPENKWQCYLFLQLGPYMCEWIVLLHRHNALTHSLTSVCLHADSNFNITKYGKPDKL